MTKHSITDVLKTETEEFANLSQLVLISLTDPAIKVRLAAIEGLHYRYTPQIRRAYAVDDLLRIEVNDENGYPIPHFVGIIPEEYQTEEREIYPWDFDLN